MRLPNILSTLFFDQAKIASFSDRIVAATAIADPAQRLLQYRSLCTETENTHFLNARGRLARKAFGSTFLMCYGAFVAAIGISLAGISIAPVVAPIVAVGGAVTYLVSSVGLCAVDLMNFVATKQHTTKLNALYKHDIANIALADVRSSPHLDAVLDSFPEIKSRFHDVAVRGAIKGEVQAQLPPPRVVIEKRLQLPAA